MGTKKNPKKIRLDEFEVVRGAWAESASGPGWANTIVWVSIYDATTGKTRLEDIQPDERSLWMSHIFPLCLAASSALNAAVIEMTVKKRPKRKPGDIRERFGDIANGRD